MSEDGQSSHPLMPDLLFHRDSFIHHLTKIHFHVGEDPALVPQIMRWIGTCQRDAHECRALGYQILMDHGEFLIGKVTGNAPATFARVSELYEQRKIQVSEAERLAISTQWPACRIVPGRTLAAQEVHLKYYTLEIHVGKSEKELKKRLDDEPDIPFASSFFDQQTAESAVAKILTLYSLYISTKFAAGKKQVDLPKEAGGINVGVPVGLVAKRDGTTTISNCVRICLKRDANDAFSFRIKSAYPIL